MKTNELIEILRDESNPNVLDYIDEAADTLESQQKRIEELEAEHRWIPVTERLPKPFESVLAYIPSEAPLPTVHESYIADHDEWVCILTVERYKPGEVTHWMPLPEPPKEG